MGASSPASCASGGPGLGDCGSNKESCCTSALVAGGTYYRTYANNGTGPTGKADPATVIGFRLDKYDVTVGRFRQFVNRWNGGWTPGAGSGKHSHLNGGQGLVDVAALPDAGTVYETGWVTADDSNIAPTNANLACDGAYQTWTDAASTQEDLPINCVNWYESYAFCIWDGGFLPSEAEWEYAAAGGSEQREYPWGTTAPGATNGYAIFGDGVGGNCYYPTGTLAPCTGVANIAPVGTATLGAGLWGQLDLAGNVWQWNLDWFHSAYADCTDCADLTATATCAGPPCQPGGPSFRVFRGGAFNYDVSALLPPTRYGNPPTTRNRILGFRCARSP
jgi:formylglycine-generating enzyme required for sulfatase activity